MAVEQTRASICASCPAPLGMRKVDKPWACAWRSTLVTKAASKATGAKSASCRCEKRTPCSADALRKRVLRDGTMANIDPVVDLYNAVSIRYAIAVGGENAAAYVGTPTLTLADGSELFDTIKEGAPAHEHPDAGEVVWRDDLGVTCRRWNWRQGVRTRLDAHAKEMWFILESLPEMPLDALHAAGEELMSGLRQMMPGAEIESMLVGV